MQQCATFPYRTAVSKASFKTTWIDLPNINKSSNIDKSNGSTAKNRLLPLNILQNKNEVFHYGFLQ